VHRPGEGEHHAAGDCEIVFKATAEGTDGTFFLNFNTPAGWENYMRDLAEASRAGALTREAIGQVASRHDFHLA
jgi:hypothetical protein